MTSRQAASTSLAGDPGADRGDAGRLRLGDHVEHAAAGSADGSPTMTVRVMSEQ